MPHVSRQDSSRLLAIQRIWGGCAVGAPGQAAGFAALGVLLPVGEFFCIACHGVSLRDVGAGEFAAGG